MTVTRQVDQAGREILDVLEEGDVRGLGFVAGSTTAGVIGAQEIADRVLPLLGMNRNPQNATEFAASAGVKGITAVGIGAVGTRLTGLPLLIAAFAGVGALAGAGADFVNAVQRTGFLAESPIQQARMQQSGGGSTSTSTSTPSASRSGTATPARADVTV